MKAMPVCLLMLSCVVTVNAVYHENQTCHQIMKENGLTNSFPGAVAHGIHSITLEDIRYYFKPDATETNYIPTVNNDLSENATLVLPHAKLYGYDTSFKSISMRHLDKVLRDMNKTNWYLANYNTLSKVAHAIHMEEVWAKIKVHYDAISLLGYNKDLCHCVRDTHGNGILKVLPLMALKIRYPGITSGKTCRLGRCKRANDLRHPGPGSIQPNRGYDIWYHFGGYRVGYKFFQTSKNKTTPKLWKFDFDDKLEHVRRKVSTELVDGDEGMNGLYGEDDWSYWKSVMRNMVAHDDYECAMFLYCMLNE